MTVSKVWGKRDSRRQIWQWVFCMAGGDNLIYRVIKHFQILDLNLPNYPLKKNTSKGPIQGHFATKVRFLNYKVKP